MEIQILLFPGFDELDVVGPWEVLRMAEAQGTKLQTRLVTSHPATTVTGSNGLQIFSQGVLQEDSLDLLVVPGGGWIDRKPQGAYAEAQRGDLPKLLAQVHARGKILASVCAGAMLLAAAGLTRGRACTTHHSVREELRASGARLIDARVVDDGDLITCGGVTSGIDLGLWLVERFGGTQLSDSIAGILEYARSDKIWKRES